MSTNKIIEALQESSNMKEFVAVFWRGNPQLKNGGYETERTIEAKTLKAAEKKAKEIEKNVAYGSMSLLRVKEKETVQESNNFKSRLEKIENLANEEVEEGSNFKSRLEKLDKMENESKVTEDGVLDRKQYSVDEDKWITIKGTHVLTDDDGNIKNEKIRDKIEGKSGNKVENKKSGKKLQLNSIKNLKDAARFDAKANNGTYGGRIPDLVKKLKNDGMDDESASTVKDALNNLNFKLRNYYHMADKGQFDRFEPEDVKKDIKKYSDEMRKAGLDDGSIDKILRHTGMDDFYM